MIYKKSPAQFERITFLHFFVGFILILMIFAVPLRPDIYQHDRGSATIILDGENTVRSFDRYYPCIQPGPEGSKLTIKGDGKLTTEVVGEAGIGISNGIACGDIEIQGGDITLKDTYVGIGGCFGSCGDITISGGTIMAQGGEVGIGSSGYESSCGDITITGGTITAQGDVDPGIGSGLFGSCGDINISWSENFVSLTAIKGHGADYPIGSTNHHSNCGQITFDGKIIKERNDDYLVVRNGRFYGDLKLTISTTLPEGVNETDEEAVKPYKDNTWTLTPQ